jgi:putative membrane protein
MKRHTFLLAALLGPLLIFGLALCPHTASANEAAAMKKNGSEYIKNTYQDGQFEIEAGKLAADRASSDKVKQFGNMMVDDHSKINGELKTLADKYNIQVNDTLNTDQQKKIRHLQTLQGTAFDKEYCALMIKGHEKAVHATQIETKSASNSDLKQLAKNTLPMLKNHLQEAKDMGK